MIRTLSQEVAQSLLCRGRFARLACISNGEPYIVPVNYFIDEDCAYVHSLPGRKIEALRLNPRACLQVDEITNESEWQSVLAYGNYEEIDDDDERDRILQSFCRCFPLLTPVESAIIQGATGLPIVVFRIRIDSVSGIREG